ncbi:hypothetical protein AVEN_156115-1 [Araneus ventricosus]|uniref:Uncharacterized protein n=1 Tax=Araneus ventricosus TaxID=182803 RepID=A0A4Y2S269_ARAVE|nr:hypothetical protein AVEN_156115-1 [Araneus ventricosus]
MWGLIKIVEEYPKDSRLGRQRMPAPPPYSIEDSSCMLAWCTLNLTPWVERTSQMWCKSSERRVPFPRFPRYLAMVRNNEIHLGFRMGR